MQAGRDVPLSVSGQGPARGSMVSVAVLETMVRIPGERLRGNWVEMLQHEATHRYKYLHAFLLVEVEYLQLVRQNGFCFDLFNLLYSLLW